MKRTDPPRGRTETQTSRPVIRGIIRDQDDVWRHIRDCLKRSDAVDGDEDFLVDAS